MSRRSPQGLPRLHEPEAWRRAGPWVGAFAVWTVIGIFTAQQRYQAVRLRGYELPWYDTLGTSLTHAWVWALFTVLIFHVVRRFPLERERLARSVPAHLTAALAICVLYAAVATVIGPWVESYPPQPLGARFLDSLAMNGASYLGVVGVAQALWYYAMYHDREAEADELRAELTTAQLESLKAQLQPHFLFNTLNATAETVYRDPDHANRLITDLGALLRRSVELSAGQEVSLRTELEFLQAYLEIVRARFGERLEIRSRLEAGTLDSLVPPFLLQPLAENALRHGIERTNEPGVIEIVAARDGDRLVLTVFDNGPGMAQYRDRSPGIGLRNTQLRLQSMYGQRQTFEIIRRAEGGTLVTVTLPFRVAAPSPLEMAGA